MPAPGDQHTGTAAPFAEPQQRISEYTAQEIATLQSRLEKQLGPEYLSTRPGPKGMKVYYVSADKCIALANDVFGFNGWSSSIQNIEVDFFDQDKKTNRITMGVSVIVRVTLRDGTYHEDLGYGQIDGLTSRAAAYEKAKKEGTTDALKRALRQFGNVLGNCIYDKTYVQKISRVKAAPVKFDESCLHRHPDFVPRKAPAAAAGVPSEENTTAPPAKPPPPPQLPSAESFEDFLGDLDEVDFNITDDGHPDQFLVPITTDVKPEPSRESSASRNESSSGDSNGNSAMQPPVNQFSRTGPAGNTNNPPRPPPQTPAQQPPRINTSKFPGAGQAQNRIPPGGPRPPQQFNQNRPAPQHNNIKPTGNQNPNPQTLMTPQRTGANDQPADNHQQSNNAGAAAGEVGFFSARAVKGVSEEALVSGKFVPKPGQGQAFNPHAVTPSIPRTPGIDHSASKPLSRAGQHLAPRQPGDDDDGGDDDVNVRAMTKPGGAGAAAGGQQQPPGGPAHGGGGGGGLGAPRPAALTGVRPGNLVNPQLDQTRRIGAPGSLSPLGNRGQFRPLTVKRPAGAGGGGGGDGLQTGPAGVANGGSRVPLGDVSANAAVGGLGVGGGDGIKRDLKRQRTS